MTLKYTVLALSLVAAGCVGSRLHYAQAPIDPPSKAAVVESDPVPGRRAALKKKVDSDKGDSGRDTHFAAAELFLLKRLPPGETELPVSRYQTAREHIRAMPRAAASSEWASLGPGNIGGRTRSLAIDPQNANIMYAGAVTGGVWKTTNAGQTWSVLTDLLPVLNIGALAIDPANPNTLYAGTGEYYGGWPGQGIFKSTDAGSTWTQLPEKFTYVNRLIVSPNSSSRLYAATSSGVWSSLNGGNTWTQTLAVSAYGCQDLAIRQDQKTDYLFASCGGANATAAFSIYRNQDAAGSGTWQVVQTAAGMGWTSLAIAPSQPTTIYALASVGNGLKPGNQNEMLAVYRSTSNGDSGTWTAQATNTDADYTNRELLSYTEDVLGNYCSGGAFNPTYSGTWSNVLAVDPVNPNRVWAAGVDVFRSDDGGATWGVASLWYLAQSSPQYSHADRHLFVFPPGYDGVTNQTMFLATDGGVFRTDNATAAVSTGPKGACESDFVSNSAVHWVNLNQSYVATQFYFGALYPGGQVYFGGSQDNDAERGTDIAGFNQWTLFDAGDGGAVIIDPADANHVVIDGTQLAQQITTDGVDFGDATAGVTEEADQFPLIAYMAADPNEGNHIFLGGTTNLWRSVNGGASWTAAAPVEAASGVSAIAVSPFNSNTVFFGSQLGYIYQSTIALTSNGTAKWQSSQPRKGYVASVVFDPTNPSVMYATYSSLKSASTDAHVYKSTDGGATWYASDGSGATSAPDIATFYLLVNPLQPQQLFLGTDLGILVSQDGGVTWNAFTAGLPEVIVEYLSIDQTNNWLIAWTYGRGAYRIPLPGAANTNCTYSVNPTPTAFNGFGGVFPIAVTAPAGCAWTALPGSIPGAFLFQSPAQGLGSGTAYLWVTPNSGSAATDTVVVANTAIPVSQSAATRGAKGTNSSSSAGALSVPGYSYVSNSTFSANPANPVHSCTGSADFRNAWWQIAPTTSGLLQARAAGFRADIFGNSGIVLTVYAQSAPSVELGCDAALRDTSGEIDAVVNFAVTAGATYLIEVSALASADTGTVELLISGGAPPLSLSVSPATAVLPPGSTGQQFTAQVLNTPNTGVRWSISPSLGRISPSGLYTPPGPVNAPTTVTVTATSFADSTRHNTATVSLLPSTGTAPLIALVANVTGEGAAIGQNTWAEIKGVNLAPDTRIWQGSDFVNGQLPTQLDGVGVTVNGKPAYIYYISPSQVNILTPLDSTTGTVPVQLTTSAGTSNIATATLQAYAPGLFVYGGSYAAATHADGSLIGPSALYPGTTTPAQPGEAIVLYANGFGQSNPAIVAGSDVQAGALPTNPLVTVGGYPATVQFAGVVSAGLYQFNIIVPAAVPNGNNVVSIQYNGFTAQSGVLVTVQQ